MEVSLNQLGYFSGAIEPTDGRIVWCRRYPVRSGFVTQSKNGQPVAPLMGEYREYDCGVTGIQVFPVCWFSLCNDYALLSRITPISTTLTQVKYYWLVDEGAQEGIDYITDKVVEFWTITAEEDMVLCEANQRGVRSSWYVPGPLSETETDVDRFIEWYLSQLASSS